jgi:hypothetical protein
MTDDAQPRFLVSPHPDLVTLLVALFAVLLAASTIGYALRAPAVAGRHQCRDREPERPDPAWWVMVVLMAVALLAGRAGWWCCSRFCSFAALREFLTLTSTRRADHWALAGASSSCCRCSTGWSTSTGTGSTRSSSRSTRSCHADRGRPARRHRELPGADLGGAVGADDLRLLRLARAGAADLADSRLRGPHGDADRLPRHRRAEQRRAAICLGQARSAAPRSRRSCRRRRPSRASSAARSARRARRDAVVDDARSRRSRQRCCRWSSC